MIFIKITEITMLIHVDYNDIISININKNNNHKTDDNKQAVK